MHDHHPRYDRPDIGVRRPGPVFLAEEREPERRGLRWLHRLILLVLLAVGLTVLYYSVRERRPELPGTEVIVPVEPGPR